MKLFSLFLIASGCIAAQTLTLTGPASVSPGQTVPLTLSLAGSTGKNITGLTWTATPSAGAIILPSTPTTSLGKGIYCATSNQICLIIGMINTTLSNVAFVDGVVAQVQIQVPATATGSISIPLSALVAVDASGTNVTLAAGVTLTLPILSKCDIDKNGVINSTDVMSVVNGILGVTACPISSCTLQSAIQVLIAAAGQSCTLQ